MDMEEEKKSTEVSPTSPASTTGTFTTSMSRTSQSPNNDSPTSPTSSHEQQQQQPQQQQEKKDIGKVDLSNCSFTLEKTNSQVKITGVHESLLQESEKDILWYKENFLGKPHFNMLAVESPLGPLAVSIIKEKDHFKLLIRSTTGSERLIVQSNSISSPLIRRMFGISPSLKNVIHAASTTLPVDSLILCKDANLPKELLSMEERLVIRRYKFGVLHVTGDQIIEEEAFQNNWSDSLNEFKTFLNFMGEYIELKGWKGYRAGLDCNSNQTGTHSYYTKWQEYEIMFHVAPLLPFNETDKQQLERKRHVGNDLVVIIFSESSKPFKISSITSQQNHVFAIVTPVNDGYELKILNKTGVPSYTPELPEPVYLEKTAVCRDFLLHKLINAERACYKSPSFAPKISRTRSAFIKELASSFISK